MFLQFYRVFIEYVAWLKISGQLSHSNLHVLRIYPSKGNKASRKDPAQEFYRYISIFLHGRKTNSLRRLQ